MLLLRRSRSRELRSRLGGRLLADARGPRASASRSTCSPLGSRRRSATVAARSRARPRARGARPGRRAGAASARSPPRPLSRSSTSAAPCVQPARPRARLGGAPSPTSRSGRPSCPRARRATCSRASGEGLGAQLGGALFEPRGGLTAQPSRPLTPELLLARSSAGACAPQRGRDGRARAGARSPPPPRSARAPALRARSASCARSGGAPSASARAASTSARPAGCRLDRGLGPSPPARGLQFGLAQACPSPRARCSASHPRGLGLREPAAGPRRPDALRRGARRAGAAPRPRARPRPDREPRLSAPRPSTAPRASVQPPCRNTGAARPPTALSGELAAGRSGRAASGLDDLRRSPPEGPGGRTPGTGRAYPALTERPGQPSAAISRRGALGERHHRQLRVDPDRRREHRWRRRGEVLGPVDAEVARVDRPRRPGRVPSALPPWGWPVPSWMSSLERTISDQPLELSGAGERVILEGRGHHPPRAGLEIDPPGELQPLDQALEVRAPWACRRRRRRRRAPSRPSPLDSLPIDHPGRRHVRVAQHVAAVVARTSPASPAPGRAPG